MNLSRALVTSLLLSFAAGCGLSRTGAGDTATAKQGDTATDRSTDTAAGR